MRPGRILYSREGAAAFTLGGRDVWRRPAVTQPSGLWPSLGDHHEVLTYFVGNYFVMRSATVLLAARSQRFATVYIQASAL
jgi:hypothetical protein